MDHTPVYPREVIARALQLSASAIILTHNHPSGDPTPSKADIDMTKTIANIGAQMGIVVHDHIIIGKNGHASLKGLKSLFAERKHNQMRHTKSPYPGSVLNGGLNQSG